MDSLEGATFPGATFDLLLPWKFRCLREADDVSRCNETLSAMSAILLQTLGETMHNRHGSLLSFNEFREEEKTRFQSSVGKDGRLRDYEALELRINPTQIEIDNDSDDLVTRIELDSANYPGTLVEVRSYHIKHFQRS